MSELTHTRAPWSIIEHSWSDTSIQAQDGGTICKLSIYDEADEDTQESLERIMDANARLIAAAPELLSTCETIMGAIAGHTDWHPDPEVDDAGWNPDYHIEITLTVADCRLLKSAITRATGKEATQ